MNEKNVNVVLMAPTPPPAGGIGAWAQRYLFLADRYKINALLCDESLIGKRVVFGEKSKKNLFNEIKRSFKIWKQLKNCLKEFGNNAIVHCCIPAMTNSLLREYFSLKIAKKRKVKFVFHFRSTIPNSINSKFSRFLLKKVLKKTNHCIVLNSISKTYLTQFISEDKISVVPNFIEEKEIFPKESFRSNIKKALYVGGVIPEKGCDIIVEAASKMPSIDFVLVGKISDAIKNVVLEKGITNVILKGELSKNEVQLEMKDSDVFLFLSRYKGEGFSNAVIEAMACGLPCVVTDWAANKDQIGIYGQELCVESDNSQQLIDILQSINDKNKRMEISSYNVQRVKDLYSETVVMNSYLEIYNFLKMQR